MFSTNEPAALNVCFVLAINCACAKMPKHNRMQARKDFKNMFFSIMVLVIGYSSNQMYTNSYMERRIGWVVKKDVCFATFSLKRSLVPAGFSQA